MSSRNAYIRVSSVQLSTCTTALSKRSRYFFNASVSPCLMPNRWDAPSFLVFELRNAAANASASCLKQPIDPGASLQYHWRAAPVKVKQNDLHRAASLAFWISMWAW
ncbi:hypothetical protein TIFTF001_038262 [Ficus carica]|uniref:Uncharacterized protein n=1 Tax=Ficus carica TaxID=3494 RepID=A0AA88E7F0_FICCA|nr:hypothetical protein TIFTF001_038262 [Ficus carica]